MSDVDRAYRARLVTHEELVGRMKPGDALSFGTWMGQAHGVMRALVRHGQHLDPLYVFCSPASDVGELLALPNVRCVSSFLGLAARTTLRDGRVVSNIVARHPAGTRITIPEHTADWVVTEYGAARLKFLSLEWRAAALIDLAHPDDRAELTTHATANGLNLARLANQRRPPDHFFSRAVGL